MKPETNAAIDRVFTDAGAEFKRACDAIFANLLPMSDQNLLPHPEASTNGTFIWGTADRAWIEQFGHESSFELPPRLLAMWGMTNEEACKFVTAAINEKAAKLFATRPSQTQPTRA